MSAVQDILSKAATNPATTPMNAAESFFDAIGLMRGDFAPVGRAVVGFGIGSAVIWAVRPSFAFSSDGHALPWGKGGTSLPWYTLPAALGIFCGLFV